MLDRKLLLAHLAAVLLTMTGCHGGGSNEPSNPTSPSSSILVYADPKPGGFRFVRNAGLSTSTHLVLDLVAPSTEKGAGVAVALQGDASRLVWTRVTSGDVQLVQNGTVLSPGPSLIQASTSGNTLQVLVAQPGTASPVAFTGPLLRIALDPISGVSPGTISLAAPKGQVSRGDGSISTIAISVGTLSYQ